MNYIGVSCGYHDAAVSVVDESGEILFASHSERYSKIKHDKNLHVDLLQSATSKCKSGINSLHYYEKPILKWLRQIRSGELPGIKKLNPKNIIGEQAFNIFDVDRVHTHSHHLSHCAAGFQTSPFDKATVVVIDAIGEWDTATIWGAQYVDGKANYKKLWSRKYPHSIGLFYSALTKRVGLRPLDEEYILMGMSGWGQPHHYAKLQSELVEDPNEVRFRQNLHIGLPPKFLLNATDIDIASSAQKLLEDLIYNIMNRAKSYGWSNNLVYMGGVALNCLANRNLGNYFESIWIMPNPGDAGSSLGAAALGYGKKLKWTNAYLGHNIPGEYPVNELINELITNKIVGVASGNAEWGPRALGNRSLLADPRGTEIKDKVNDIKRRQRFRPFAPVILEEYVDKYFDMPRGWVDSRYMQIVAKCKNPELYPAIVHVDGTSRIQTVPNDGSGIRKLLEQWYLLTGCPMLLNTSLNIRGEPMVNDREDAHRFEKMYNVKVFS
jgi:carbamoyltransferase